MIISKINSFLDLILIFLIKIYRYFFSPLLKNSCRYMPSCSEYAIDALKEHGILLGSYYSLKRISKCHPLGDSGYDPVPKKNINSIKDI